VARARKNGSSGISPVQVQDMDLRAKSMELGLYLVN